MGLLDETGICRLLRRVRLVCGGRILAKRVVRLVVHISLAFGVCRKASLAHSVGVAADDAATRWLVEVTLFVLL